MKKINLIPICFALTISLWPALSQARGWAPRSFYEARNAYARAYQAMLFQIPRYPVYCTAYDVHNYIQAPVFRTEFNSEPQTNTIVQLNYQNWNGGGYPDSVTRYQIMPGQTYYNNIGYFVQSIRTDGRNVYVERSGGQETGIHGIDNPGLPTTHYWFCSPRQ